MSLHCLVCGTEATRDEKGQIQGCAVCGSFMFGNLALGEKVPPLLPGQDPPQGPIPGVLGLFEPEVKYPFRLRPKDRDFLRSIRVSWEKAEEET